MLSVNCSFIKVVAVTPATKAPAAPAAQVSLKDDDSATSLKAKPGAAKKPATTALNTIENPITTLWVVVFSSCICKGALLYSPILLQKSFTFWKESSLLTQNKNFWLTL